MTKVVKVKGIKKSEMNFHQRLAYKAFDQAYSDVVGGLCNTIQDFAEDTEEYQGAIADLKDRKNLIEWIKDETKDYINQWVGKSARFASNKFIEDRIKVRFSKDDELQEIWGEKYEVEFIK